MCRLLYIRSNTTFDTSSHLKIFAQICKNSKEYQGHGWGCAYLKNQDWVRYKNIKPIWEDNLNQFNGTRMLIAHARSAFRDQDIGLENNMPFYKGELAFIFNGELHGVKIKEEGRIGAEKIFNFLTRFYDDNLLKAIQKGVKILERRTRYIKAMNIVISDKNRAFIISKFNEDPEYFTIYYKETDQERIICSEPYPGESNWQKLKNGTIGVF